MIVSPPAGYSIVEFDTGKGRAAVLWPLRVSPEERAALLAGLAGLDRAISRGEYEERAPKDCADDLIDEMRVAPLDS